MLVVLGRRDRKLALCVDDVDDPQEIDPADVTPADRYDGIDLLPHREALVAVVKTARGLRALIDPDALLPAELSRALPSLVKEAMAAAEAT